MGVDDWHPDGWRYADALGTFHEWAAHKRNQLVQSGKARLYPEQEDTQAMAMDTKTPTADDIMATAVDEAYDGTAHPEDTPLNWARAKQAVASGLAALAAAGYAVRPMADSNKRMRIINTTGLSNDTKVYAAGEDVTTKLGIIAVDLRLEAAEIVKAAVTVFMDAIEVEPHVVRWLAHHLVTDKPTELASMTFRDGTTTMFHENGGVEIFLPLEKADAE